MDFYSVHLYDWPEWKSDNKVIRAGGHVEATFDMLAWYDVNKFGVDKRKPIVISEYGAVGAYIGQAAPAADPQRRDWENLKPFNSMLMQFLERPDYIVKSMPFTPVKAVWGDWSTAAKDRYPYTMMDKDASGKWQWSEFIKFYELWSDRITSYNVCYTKLLRFSGLYVRGGGPDQNLVLMDDVPVYNVDHLLGFFSIFNSDAVITSYSIHYTKLYDLNNIGLAKKIRHVF